MISNLSDILLKKKEKSSFKMIFYLNMQAKKKKEVQHIYLKMPT